MKFKNVLKEAFEKKYNNNRIVHTVPTKSPPKKSWSELSPSQRMEIRRLKKEVDKNAKKFDRKDIVDKYFEKAKSTMKTRLKDYSDKEIRDFIDKETSLEYSKSGSVKPTTWSWVSRRLRQEFGVMI